MTRAGPDTIGEMPTEPPESWFEIPSPVPEDEDVVAVGADLEPGTILQAYRKGLFPMNLQDGSLAWWSPVERAILPLDGLRITRSLAQSTRRFQVTVDQDFAGVVQGCADPERERGWITREFMTAYSELHRLGWAHSIEVWDAQDRLAGGLYGVAVGGLFCGESMFYQARDASKVAMVHLVVLMNEGGGRMIDVQWQNPHLESMGAVVIGRDEYLRRLPEALEARGPFGRAGG